jgi:RNA polymerase sigma factor (sigma-70 family)
LYVDKTATGEQMDAGGSRARAYLQRFLQENAASLQGIICGYVAKMGLATGANIEGVAAEVFQDAALETLANAERFNPEMQPRPWFLAIAANVLKRHRASYARRYKFEVLVGKLAERPEQENEQDILDQIMAWSGGAPGPEQALVTRESVRELLALVAPEDARLLNMALLQGWDANALARLLGITPGAARVRVHRALSRLRAAWRTSEQRKEQNRG